MPAEPAPPRKRDSGRSSGLPEIRASPKVYWPACQHGEGLPVEDPHPVRKRDPSTPIVGLNDAKLGDYWSWAYSDVLSNVNRSVFAEFLVARALGLDANPRIEWDAYDLNYSGIRIEVKAAGRLQSWKQRANSPIKF